MLNWFGEIDAAVTELERLLRLWPNNPSVRSYMRTYGPAAPLRAAAGQAVDDESPISADEAALRSIAAKAPPVAAFRRPALDDDASRDVQVLEVSGADTAILIFAGDNDTLSIPLGLFDRFLAPLPASVIYLKDFNRLRYLRGIRSLAGDYAGTLAALRRQLAALGVRRICTFGNCNGGCGAIRYGLELGADRIVTFQTPTYVPPESPTKLEQAQNFMRTRLAAAVPAELTDLKPLLDASDHTARIEFFTRAEHPRDRLYAAHLAGIEGIHFHPCPGPMGDALLYRTILTDEDFHTSLAGWLGLS